VTNFFSGKKWVVTGGAGFLGSFVVEKLRSRGATEILVPRKRDYDLTRREDAERLYADTHPDVLIHLAATVGGIGANQENPGRFFFENMSMGLHVIEEGRRYGRLQKLVLVGTTCSYPKHTPTPFVEEDLWNGYPEETNAPYAIAKKAMLVMAQGYREQYGLHSIYLIPANLYGPGDNFDPSTSHVIPALIRKFLEAKRLGTPSVTVWGTGSASREFLYVEDAAEGILLSAERYNGPEPVNLGTGAEIQVRELVSLVSRLVDYRGQVQWDTSKPDGQPRRRLSVEKAIQGFGFRANTNLETGLRATIDWYAATLREAPGLRTASGGS
jgi:GDP-L-fucose synthase